MSGSDKCSKEKQIRVGGEINESRATAMKSFFKEAIVSYDLTEEKETEWIQMWAPDTGDKNEPSLWMSRKNEHGQIGQ